MQALVLVYGDVHGVGFRSYAKRLAQQLNLVGLVRNEPQGVKVFLDGEKPAIEKFLETVKRVKQTGFFGANVEKVETFWQGGRAFQPAWRSYKGFEIDY